MKRWSPVLLLLLLAGCSRQVLVSPKEIHPGASFRNARVTTLDGYVYDFDRVEFQGDSLIGYRKVTEERIEEGYVAYVEVPRRTAIPLGLVDRVERERRDLGAALLYGAGMAAVGIIFADIATPDEPKRESPPRGKPPITSPDAY
jgi:hypothetical protein